MSEGILSLPADQYFAADGVSKSMLDIIGEKTPAHLRYYLDNPKPEPTAAQRFGTLCHRAMLEPDTCKDAFYVRPDGMSFTTKDGRAWKEEHADRPIITAEEANQLSSMVFAVAKHPMAARLFSLGKSEQCLFAEDDQGTLRKGRLDYVSESGNVLPDLKTCESAAPDDFEKQIVKYRYHVQAAYYLSLCKLCGLDKNTFIFVCVEKSPPYAVAVYNLAADAIDAGRGLYHHDLQVYRNCLESGDWPAYSTGIQGISLPAWELKRLEAL